MPKAPRARNLQACLTCRKRKVKCDESRPQCGACLQRDQACQWPEKVGPGSFQYVSFGEDVQNQAHLTSPIIPQHDEGALSNRSGISKTAKSRAESKIPALFKQRLLEIFSQTHSSLELCGCIDQELLKGGTAANDTRFLLESIYALSSLYITDMDVSVYGSQFSNSKAAAIHFRSMAQASSRHLSDEPSAITIQGNLVLGLCELLTMTTSKAWLHVGLAIRMAQALRMRRECNRRLIPQQREIRRRTFWACIILDRLIAYCSFRTQTIDLALVELHLPCNDRSFAFGNDIPGPLIHEIGTDLDNARDHSILSYFVKTLLLWSPVAKAHVDGGRAVQQSNEQFQIFSTDCETKMEQWRDSLPVDLQWSERNLQAHNTLQQTFAFVSTHFLIEHAMFLGHHEYLPQNEEGDFLRLNRHRKQECGASGIERSNATTIEICRKSANRIVSMLKLIDSKVGGVENIQPSVCMGMPMVTAATVLLWYYHHSQRATTSFATEDTDIELARSHADYIRSIFEVWAKNWNLARAWKDSIKLLDDFYQLRHGRGSGIVGAGTALGGENKDDTVTQRNETESARSSPGPIHGPLRDGEGFPDSSMIPSETFYKVRLITGLLLEQPELCKKFLNLNVSNSPPTHVSDGQIALLGTDFDLSWLNDLDWEMTTSMLWQNEAQF